MMFARALLFAFAWLMASPVLAEVSVASVLVKAGYFQAEDCAPTADPKAYNECVCQANIKKAQVSGIPIEIAASINQKLAMLPEKLAAESCDGKATTPPAAGLKMNIASADYVVSYQNPTTLTTLITYSTYGAGSEHALDGAEGFTFDIATGLQVDPLQLLTPEARKKADDFVKQELAKKYGSVMYDELKNRAEPYLTENGCDSCTMFYTQDGWVVRFQLTAIAPFASGQPEVVLPADVIAPPEQLIATAPTANPKS